MSLPNAEQDYGKGENVLRLAISNALREVHTTIPGIVESYDPETRTATVRPAARRKTVGKDVFDQQPELLNVPVMFPSNGRSVVYFHLVKGDAVQILYNQRGIQPFVDGRDEYDPELGTELGANPVAVLGWSGVDYAPPDPPAGAEQFDMVLQSGSAFIGFANNAIHVSATDFRYNGRRVETDR